MCNASCVIFGANNLLEGDIGNKRVLEVGAYNVNGSLRSIISKYHPIEYLGIDIIGGPGVDVICGIEEAVNRFGKDSFDLVVSNELLEHVKDWRLGISNIKNLVKPGGKVLITTRSYGFAYHGYPCDYWRYEIDDMKNIFSDFEIIKLERDSQDPGVFILAKKTEKFQEKDLTSYKLFSVVAGKKIKEIFFKDYFSICYFIIVIKESLKRIFQRFIK
ncbi:MAG: bifunctional 3-demethylubiquinone-9 3-methyltransferase/ 2-octaprenyl-6-hydroxy phenol methylase [Parcubacteria group bacterium ADurb.Bin316]|nr:MAG: bifunctional 3-demethylubiquinone-9 3-methyltransferase/ 2-octaprenyl-6-hydroxy phenol methylase [Parcubacteria group bacterium ADurb.Bin316]HOZ56497.1 methyltransferase domain-containing protein [bacterium]